MSVSAQLEYYGDQVFANLAFLSSELQVLTAFSASPLL